MTQCELCEGTGVETTFWGGVYHPLGVVQVRGEKHDPARDFPGGTFFGGTSQQQCTACLGTGVAS